MLFSIRSLKIRSKCGTSAPVARRTSESINSGGCRSHCIAFMKPFKMNIARAMSVCCSRKKARIRSYAGTKRSMLHTKGQ